MITICVHTPAHASSSADLLQQVKKHSTHVKTMQTKFLQEKHVDFLDAPITTTGHMYFVKKENNSYSLLWEYDAPSASGIWFNNDVSWIWTQKRESLRQSKGYENTFVNTMMEQIIFWLHIDPQKIESLYQLELLGTHSIKLIPKRKEMFQSITVTFHTDLKGLETLVLEEKDNSTRLSFFETKYNTPMLRTFIDGTPLP